MTDTALQTEGSPRKTTRRRRVLIIVVAVLALAGLGTAAALITQNILKPEDTAPAAPATGGPPAGFTEFRDEKTGVALSYPSSWVRLTPKDPGEVRLILQAQNGPQEAFFLMRARELPNPVGQPEIEAAIREAVVQIEGANNKADVVATNPIIVGGLPGHWFLYSIQDPVSGQLQTHSHFVLFKDQTVINLLYQTTPGESLKKFAPTFDQMNASFRVLEG